MVPVMVPVMVPATVPEGVWQRCVSGAILVVHGSDRLLDHRHSV